MAELVAAFRLGDRAGTVIVRTTAHGPVSDPRPARTPCSPDADRRVAVDPTSPIDPYPSHRSQIETVLDDTFCRVGEVRGDPGRGHGGVYGEAQEGGSAARDVQGRPRGHSSNVGSGVDERDFRPERWERVRDVRGVSRIWGPSRAVGEDASVSGGVQSEWFSTWLESSIEKFFT